MVGSSLVKLVGAFILGLTLALGGALIFVRTRPPHAGIPTVQVQERPVAAEPVSQPAPAEPPDAQASRTSEEPVEKARPNLSAQVEPRITRKAEARNWGKRSLSQSLPPVQIVQNTPPALPTAPVPTYPSLSETVQEETAPAVQASPQPHVVELTAGTTLAIRLGETISTEHNYTGDTFRSTLDAPIIRDGFIIAEKGSKVLGRVADATSAGRVRGVSNLKLTLTEINTTDGQRIKVETNSVEKSGLATTGADTAKIAGGAALGAIIGALGGGGKGAAIGAGAGGLAGTGLVLATRGKPAVLPNESRLTFQLVSPVTIAERLNH